MISVVIAVRDEPVEIVKTIRSLRATANCDLDIVVVDDESKMPLLLPNLLSERVIRNRWTIGVGASRHVGVCAARSDTVLITDAHCRFCPGWTVPLQDFPPSTLLCGQCLALRETDETWEQNHGSYYGARMVISDPDQPEARYRFLNPFWAEERPGEDSYPLSACMGALYAFSRSYFLKLGGLRMLRGFGGDEELLSLKWLRSGGEIRMCKTLKAAHKFTKDNRPRFTLSMAEVLINKCTTALTCCPEEVSADMIKSLGVGADVRKIQDAIKAQWHQIAAEKAQLDALFTVPWDDYLRLVESIDSRK